MSVKGYKVFSPNWTCKSFQYEVGKTYKYDGDIKICRAGFHFCQRAIDCFNYYKFSSKNKVAEVKATGLVITENNKSVTDKITIVREIGWHELLNIVNEGCGNTGYDNTGDYNSGNHNTGSHNVGNYNIGNYNTDCFNIGYYNSGRHNTGDWNTGDWNNGDYNVGNYNLGYVNTGSWNTGNYNSGNYNLGTFNTGKYNVGHNNTGNWNKTDWSSGFFNTLPPQQLIVFNKPLNMERESFLRCKGVKILIENYKNMEWILDCKDVYKAMWEKLTDEEKEAIKEIPNFDAEIFKEITGIEV